MTWTSQLFNYCERGLDPAFWAEPLNALSNAGFLAAGLIAFQHWRRQPARGTVELALIALVLMIGVGSFLFHTFATRWAMLADTLPIGIFTVAYFAYALRRFVGVGGLSLAACVAGFMGALAAVGGVRCGGGPCLNGSVGYLPTLAVLAATGLYLRVRHHPAAHSLLAAATLLAVSLIFRTMDRAVCPYTLLRTNWHTGTHALWHLLNAAVLHLLLAATMRSRAVNR